MLHYGLIENPFAIGERMNLSPGDKYYVGIPMFYGMYATNALEAAMTHGASMVIQERFDPGDGLRLIAEEKCTVMLHFYNAFGSMINHPDRGKWDVSSLRTGVTITSPENFREIARTFMPQIIRAYGLTESYGFCFMTKVSDSLEARTKNLGKALPGFEYKIVDAATGEKVPPGKEGELCLKGYVTPGYYDDPENNAAAFDDDGFFHTGDIVVEDEHGCIEFLARAKEMIKSGGINISPAALENFLLTHPKVKIVNVVGLPDKVKDEAVMAVIELKEGAEATPEEIIAYCKGNIAGYTIPKYVYFIRSDEWPLVASGKVPKNKLKELMISKLGIPQ